MRICGSISDSNPAFEPDVLDNLSTVDDHIRKQNGHKLPVQMQLFLDPMWSLRSRFADSCVPLQQVTSRYMTIRLTMVEIDEAIINGRFCAKDCKFVFEEIQKLYEAYGEYAMKLKGIQKDLRKQLNFYSGCGDSMWECMGRLAVMDQQACKIQAYCLKMTMVEYGRLEEQIDESLQNCLEILKCSVSYLTGIMNHFPEACDIDVCEC